jgi:hypothetical protein
MAPPTWQLALAMEPPLLHSPSDTNPKQVEVGAVPPLQAPPLKVPPCPLLLFDDAAVQS